MAERDPDFQVARQQAGPRIQAVRQALQAMIDLLEPRTGHHDDAAELILTVTALGDTYRELKQAMEDRVLAWLRENEDGVRSIRAGDWKWWGEKEKSVKCNDVGEAGRVLAESQLQGALDNYVAAIENNRVGSDEAWETWWVAVRDFFRSYVSTQGLKEGACHKALGDEKYAELWSETWPDKMKGGDPKTKLGVANLRFLYRSEGGSKSELEELERKKLAGGGL